MAEPSKIRPPHPTALVTGGNRGIGRAIATALKARGCAVTIGARNDADGRQAAADLGVAHARLDLEDPDSAFALMTQTGGFDILVNNAGILNDISLLDRRSDFAQAMEVMVSAPLDLIRMNLPQESLRAKNGLPRSAAKKSPNTCYAYRPPT